MHLFCTVFKLQWVICRKVTYFNLLHLHLTPLLRWSTRFEFCWDLWLLKTRVPRLSCGTVCVILRLAVLIQYRHVMDGETTYCKSLWCSWSSLKIGLPQTGPANRHLTLIKVRSDPNCPLCQEEEETVLHLLGRCNVLSLTRLNQLGPDSQLVLGYIGRQHLWSWIYDHNTEYSNDHTLYGWCRW